MIPEVGPVVQIVEEINERWSLSLVAAEKSAKSSYVETFNDNMLGGLIKVKLDDPVISEWEKLQWNEIERLRYGEVQKVKIEDPRMPNHNADATLYAWRESKHFFYTEPERVPKRGDSDFPDFEAQEMEAAAIQMYGGKNDVEWFAEGYDD